MTNSTHAARLRSTLSRLGRETAMLEATVTSLNDAELAANSLCEGWSRAHVVAHLASNAEALTRMIDVARTGEVHPMYPSRQERDAEIERRAGLERAGLLSLLEAASARFASHADQLGGELALEVLDLNGREVAATDLVSARISEVVLHHHDLGTAWTMEEADPDSLLDALESAVRVRRSQEVPGMTLVAEEGEEWVIGDGALRVESDREGLLAWLARGEERGVDAESPLPQLPVW
ncbi:MAG: maleylpyruvate isomerase family mycothiol-dependent enzyme [Micrococcus sp.]|nr:maleylpyruvate isomerase family mycothiol-dependent enzyme [Micrococcus sp.]